MRTAGVRTARVVAGSISTPVGEIAVVARGDRVIGCQFCEPEFLAELFASGETYELAADPAGAISVLHAYLDGDVDALDAIPTAATGTDFQMRVWAALRRIPAGETVSYADIAAEVGAPKAVRAVGTANGANPIGVIVPCHRVVRSDGSLGGYGGGLDRKRWLLTHERVARSGPERLPLRVGAHEVADLDH